MEKDMMAMSSSSSVRAAQPHASSRCAAMAAYGGAGPAATLVLLLPWRSGGLQRQPRVQLRLVAVAATSSLCDTAAQRCQLPPDENS